MSTAARAALITIGTRNYGQTTAPITASDVIAELKNLGYLGPKGGLTRKGSIKRERIMNAIFDAQF